MTYNAEAIEEGAAAIEREHRDEHFDDVDMDCPKCAAEWATIAGGER